MAYLRPGVHGNLKLGELPDADFFSPSRYHTTAVISRFGGIVSPHAISLLAEKFDMQIICRLAALAGVAPVSETPTPLTSARKMAINRRRILISS
jgi:hypothetical protein